MADYDFSKPAPDRSHRVPKGAGTGTGGIGLIIVGAVIVLALLYMVFGGAGVADDPTSSTAAPPEVSAPEATVPEATTPIAPTE